MEAHLKMWDIRSERNLNAEPIKSPILEMEKLKPLKQETYSDNVTNHWKSEGKKAIRSFSTSSLKAANLLL